MLDTADDLLRARLANRVSRRELIEHASRLGLSAGVAAVLLGASGDLARRGPARAAEGTVPAERRLEPRGRARAGGELTAGVVGSIETLNPYTVDLSGPGFDILSGVMDGLLRFDSRQRIRPALAESYEVADDGLTYTFRLRRNVTFHNGDPLTAEDVVASWRMLVNRELPVWSRVGWDRIASIEVTDPATLVVTTDQLFAPFLSSVAAGWQTGGVICPSRYLGTVADFAAQYDGSPVGTGPYRLKSSGGGVATLERYDRHWGGRPRLDRIHVRLFDDHEAMLAALATGEIQVAGRTGIPGENNLEAALAIEDATVLEFVGQYWQHVDIKQVGPFRETLVRQALDYATPKDRIIEEVMGGEAVRAVADQSPAGPYVHRAITPRPYDLEKGRSLLRRAGFAFGEDRVWARGEERLAIELWGESTDPNAEPALELISSSWTQLGVETRVRTAEREALYGPAGFQFSDAATAGYYRWANVNDPDDMFYWHSSQIPTSPDGAGGNFAAYFNPYPFQEEIDELTSRAAGETDPARRKRLYLEIQEVLHREVPALFVFWDKVYAAAADTVGGLWPSASTYLLWDAREWYVTR